MDTVFDIPFLFREFIRQVIRTNGTLLCKHPGMLFQIFLLIFYIALPTDLLPEKVYGFLGYIDDLIVFWLFGISFTMSMLNIMRQDNRDAMAH